MCVCIRSEITYSLYPIHKKCLHIVCRPALLVSSFFSALGPSDLNRHYSVQYIDYSSARISPSSLNMLTPL